MTEAISLKQVYDELKRIERSMATKEEILVLSDTLEILSNPATMQQIRVSDEDIKHGRGKDVSSVQDLLEEL